MSSYKKEPGDLSDGKETDEEVAARLEAAAELKKTEDKIKAARIEADKLKADNEAKRKADIKTDPAAVAARDKEVSDKIQAEIRKENEKALKYIQEFNYQREKDKYRNMYNAAYKEFGEKPENKEELEMLNTVSSPEFQLDIMREILIVIQNPEIHKDIVQIMRFLFISPIEFIYLFVVEFLKPNSEQAYGVFDSYDSIFVGLYKFIYPKYGTILWLILPIITSTKTWISGTVTNALFDKKTKPYLLILIERVVYSTMKSFLINNMLYTDSINEDVIHIIDDYLGTNANGFKVKAEIIHYYLCKFRIYIEETEITTFETHFPKFPIEKPYDVNENIKFLNDILYEFMRILYDVIDYTDDNDSKMISIRKDMLTKPPSFVSSFIDPNKQSGVLSSFGNTIIQKSSGLIRTRKYIDYLVDVVDYLAFIINNAAGQRIDDHTYMTIMLAPCKNKQEKNVFLDNKIVNDSKKPNNALFMFEFIGNVINLPIKIFWYYYRDFIMVSGLLKDMKIEDTADNNAIFKNESTFVKNNIKHPNRLVKRYFTTIIITLYKFSETVKYILDKNYSTQISESSKKTMENASSLITANTSKVGSLIGNMFTSKSVKIRTKEDKQRVINAANKQNNKPLANKLSFGGNRKTQRKIYSRITRKCIRNKCYTSSRKVNIGRNRHNQNRKHKKTIKLHFPTILP